MASLVKKIITAAKAPPALGPYRNDEDGEIQSAAPEGHGAEMKMKGIVCFSNQDGIFIWTDAKEVQAVLVDRTMYIAGQIGIEPSTGQLVSGGAKEEAKQALKNMGEILKAAGCDYGNVVKTTVLMADMKDFDDINDIYKQFFKTNFPARAAYQVAALPKGARVEIEAIAIQGSLQDASA